MNVRERFRAQPMGANASYKVGGASIGGFICVTSGTLTVTDADATVLVNGVAVTAGLMIAIPIFFNTSAGGTVTLAGGAVGTLLI